MINQIATDGQRFLTVMPALFGLITAPLQLIATVGLLLHYMGPPALVGLGVLGATVPLIRCVGVVAKEAVAEKMVHADARVRAFNEAIQGIKVIEA